MYICGVLRPGRSRAAPPGSWRPGGGTRAFPSGHQLRVRAAPWRSTITASMDDPQVALAHAVGELVDANFITRTEADALIASYNKPASPELRDILFLHWDRVAELSATNPEGASWIHSHLMTVFQALGVSAPGS